MQMKASNGRLYLVNDVDLQEQTLIFLNIIVKSNMYLASLSKAKN